MRIIALLIAGCASLYGQQPAFDVVSVKPAGPFVPGSFGRMNGGPGTPDPERISFTGVSLQTLLTRAYDVRTDQISGPSWLDGETFKYAYTITGTLPANTPVDKFRLMLQKLLAERFHLTLHHETRDFPGYELVVAPGGPKFSEAAPEAKPRAGFRFVSGPQKPDEPMPELPAGMSGNMRIPPPGQWGLFRGRYHQSMTEFIRGLGAMVNESTGVEMGKNVPRIVDKTGLKGVYEFSLEFAGISIMPMVGGEPPQTSDPGVGGQTLFVALEKQAGLQLKKVKSVPVDTLVIDHAEKVPTDN